MGRPFNTDRSAAFLSGISALVLGSALLPVNALAQDLVLPEIVVSASRFEQDPAKTGSVVEVLDKKDIDAKSLPMVADYLATIPGIQITSQGGKGTISTFMLRGFPGEYTKTLINGIDVSDVSYTRIQAHQGQFLGGLLTRLEVLKGSQSTLYGSDAIAGVVDISTMRADQHGIEHGFSLEAGSQGTVLGSYDINAGFDRGQVAFGLAGINTQGFSASSAGIEDDPFRNATGTFAARYDLTPDMSIFGSALMLNSRTEFDDLFPAPDYKLGDSDAFSTYRQNAGRIGSDFTLFDGAFHNTLSFQLSKTDRDTTNGYGMRSGFTGKRSKIDYHGRVDVAPEWTLNFGANWERMDAATSNSFKADSALYGGWAEAIYSPIEQLTLTAGVRQDQHSEFGGHTSWRATGSYLFDETSTRLHASAGTGFRAPSLFELYDIASGNPDLRPETSLSFDFGVEQRFLSDRLKADVTIFQLEVDNYITSRFTHDGSSDPWAGTWKYEQDTGTMRSRGIEFGLDYAATDWLDLKGAYTYTDARREDGSRQVRVPRHVVGLGAVAHMGDHWSLSADARVALNTIDFVGADMGPLDDYVLVNAKLAYKPNETTEFYLRAENLLNQRYEVVSEYSTAPFSIFAGMKARFGQ